MKDIDKYNSIEEFIHINNRCPDTNETRPLYNLLWERYIQSLDTEEKNIALENNNLPQEEVIKKIPIATEKFKQVMKSNDEIISIGYSERWGMHYIYVVVNCIKRQDLYKFRPNIPNFFEGWEVRLVPATIFEKIFFVIGRKFRGQNSQGI